MALTKINNNTLSAVTGLPAGVGGKVLQVVSTTKTDTFSATSNMTDITGLSVAITPSSTSNKILIIVQVHIVGDNSGTAVRLLRNSTDLALGDASGSRGRFTMIGTYAGDTPAQYSSGANHINYLDSPNTTSATTYKLQGGSYSSTFYINQTKYDSNNLNASRASSTITVMEIGA